MKKLFILFVVALCFFIGFGGYIGEKAYEINVPEDCKTIEEALDVISQSNGILFNIYLGQGEYDGFVINNQQLKGKEINVYGKAVKGVFPKISSDNRQTISVAIPGEVKFFIAFCDIVNDYEPKADETPESLWNVAGIFGEMGCTLISRYNRIYCENGSGIVFNYVQKEVAVGNTITAKNIAIAHYNNNPTTISFLNEFRNSKIGHFFTNPTDETSYYEKYQNVGQEIVFKRRQ